MAAIIDGKAVAKEVQKQIKEEVEGLDRRWGWAPGLAVVLVGDDPASHIYVRNKEKACREVGIKSFEHLLPATIPEKELLALVHQFLATLLFQTAPMDIETIVVCAVFVASCTIGASVIPAARAVASQVVQVLR